MYQYKMSTLERKAAFSLTSILVLRMLGLFMILPVFSLYANELRGATPFLIGVALGIYGLTQFAFQIPIGLLSDHVGRKKMIAIGLVIFILGSAVAALAHSIFVMIIGRALQGIGAVGSAIIALMADLTRSNQRSKAMAILGISIGLSFAFAMMFGPLLAHWVNLFWIAVILGIVALLILFYVVPTPPTLVWHADIEPEINGLIKILINQELMVLNLGIFFLHTILMATFVILPISLRSLGGFLAVHQWLVYMPTLLGAFVISLFLMIKSEKTQQLKLYFVSAIAMLGIAEFNFWFFSKNSLLSLLSLLLFFTAFSLLEAFLPSFVSRTAPLQRKGTALGIFSSSQFLGIFCGGLIGGFLYDRVGLTSVYLFCAILSLIWLGVAFKMKNPHHAFIQ